MAINAWNNLGDTTIRVAVKKNCGDHWRVQFVRIPFPEMPAKLAAGAVDAVWLSEPLRSGVLAAGGRVLFNNLTETVPTRVSLAVRCCRRCGRSSAVTPVAAEQCFRITMARPGRTTSERGDLGRTP